MSANTRLDSLHDLTKHNANLRVTCQCGKVHVYDAVRFTRYAMCRGWNTQLETWHIGSDATDAGDADHTCVPLPILLHQLIRSLEAKMSGSGW